jgi:hypothetical protein
MELAGGAPPGTPMAEHSIRSARFIKRRQSMRQGGWKVAGFAKVQGNQGLPDRHGKMSADESGWAIPSRSHAQFYREI